MKLRIRYLPIAALVMAATAAAGEGQVVVRQDFASGDLGKGWRAANPAWRVAGGELRGKGNGQLRCLTALEGDLVVSFTVWTEEKANVEVKLSDATTGIDRFTFAYLGRYHSVLKGVKACMLKGNYFVAVHPGIWIFPGRRFHFEMKMTGGEYQMRLDGALGPVYVDKVPATGPYLLRIIVAPEAEGSSLAIDDIEIRATGEGGEAPPPAATPEPARPDRDMEPVLSTASLKNVLVKNHSDASIEAASIAGEAQRMYEFLYGYAGAGPKRVVVHVGREYPSGFARPGSPDPEMFLRAGRVFDTTVDYAHEMMHCFMFRWGDLPHWFSESLSDMAYVDSEIGLYRRRKEEPFLASLVRIDHRSYELLALRQRFGAGYFPKVLRQMEKRRKECVATFRTEVPLEKRNRLILEILSAAAGQDLTRLFEEEFGFDPKTRERQRGY